MANRPSLHLPLNRSSIPRARARLIRLRVHQFYGSVTTTPAVQLVPKSWLEGKNIQHIQRPIGTRTIGRSKDSDECHQQP